MGIRARTTLLVSVVMLVLGTAIYLAYAAQTRSIVADLERSEVNDSLKRSEAVLNLRIHSLRSIAGDWAARDDTYAFVKDRDHAYVESNLPYQTLSSLGVDFMVFADSSGRIVHSVSVDPDTRKPAPLPAGLVAYLGTQPRLLHLKGPEDVVSGVLGLHEGPAAIAAEPIVRSDMRSAPDGTFIAGYFIRRDEVAEVSRLTLQPLQVYAVSTTSTLDAETASARSRLLSGEDSTVVTPRDSNTVDGFTLYSGITGPPVLLLHVAMPRSAMMTSEQTVNRSGVGVLVLLVALFGALGVVVDRTVLRRLTSLSAEVNDIGRRADPTARLSESGTDEIAVVARSLNGMLEELEHSQYLATHDALTGLHNRRYFEEAIERDVAEVTRLGGCGSVLWLDLDNFKEVNDSLGHAVGDELLTGCAGLLQDETRSYGIVARLGGDEFGVLVPHSGPEQSAAVAARLLKALSGHMFEIDGHAIRVSTSVGVVTYPADGVQVDELLSRADLAMYAAKESGRNQLYAYTEEDGIQQLMAARIKGAEQMVRALEEGRLVLYAQPSARTSDDTPGPYELLVRLIAEDGRIVPPNEIIPIAEQLGIVRDIDRWVATRAITMLAEEHEAGRDTTFSVNLSGCSFSDPELLPLIKGELVRTGAPASRIIFEITESAAIKDIHKAKQFIEALRSVGCRFALDDFGSGMSSFYYLKQLNVDLLKIDGSLVRDLDTAGQDAHFVRAIIEMCRGLGIETVAEYVENPSLRTIVDGLGIDYAQGFSIGRPEPWLQDAPQVPPGLM